MKNYFVFVNYYLSNTPSPIDCDSILMTGYDDCSDAWDAAAEHFLNYLKENGYYRFVISEFKGVE